MRLKNIFFASILWKLLLIIITSNSLCLLHLTAQSTHIPLNSPEYHTLDRIEIKSDTLDSYVHSSLKPYDRLGAVLRAESADDHNEARFKTLDRVNQYYLYKNNNEWTGWGLIESKKPFLKYFYKYQPDLLYVKDYSDFLLKVNPVINFQMGKEPDVAGIKLINTRGLELRGMISEKVGFYTFVTDNQISFPSYVDARIQESLVVPNEGRFKLYKSSLGDSIISKGVDFSTARGSVFFQPVSRIHLQLGYDKNFIGNGARSLFLSDYGNNYAFFKINTKVWRFNYQNLFTQLASQFNTTSDTLVPTKYASFHHLSLNVTKWLNIGLFEGVVFSRQNGFDFSYLNPLIFYRAVEFQRGSSDNVIVGMDFKANFLRRFSLYGQLVLDELNFGEITSNKGWWGNKYGYQIGLKYIDVAGVSNLDLQIEWNSVRPYTYTHNSTTANFTHYNQALAHPLGANFQEVLAIIRYRPNKKINAKINLMYAVYGADKDSLNWGSNIFISNLEIEQEYGNKHLQGDKTNILLADFVVSYMFKHNAFIDLTYTYRNQQNEFADTGGTSFVGLGFRLNINRRELLF